MSDAPSLPPQSDSQSAATEPAGSAPAPTAFPPAKLQPAARLALGWFWLLPGVVLAIVILVVWMSVAKRGPRIQVHFQEGYGLKAGDAVRHRGITVGEVRTIELSPDLDGVDVVIDLRPTAEGIAVENSRFWIVRPQADLTRISGLDTVVGAKYVAVSPGSGAAKRRFVGDETPVIEEDPGGLRIILQDRRMGGLRPGAPLMYRGVRIGSVVSSGLASDASAVEMQVYVLPAYKSLVRTDSQFWNVSGFKVHVGWGLSLDAESAQTVLGGGIAMATPSQPGSQVSDGRRFWLAEEEDEDWKDWNPSIPLVNPNLPDGVSLPRLVRATLQYQKRGRVYGTSTAEKRGLLLPVEGNWLLGPADLLSEPERAVTPPPVTLTFEGISQSVDTKRNDAELSWLKLAGEPITGAISSNRLRAPEAIEKCLLVADSSVEPIFVAESHLKESEMGWAIDDNAPSANLPLQLWNGAAAVSVTDGKVIGILLATEKGTKTIVPLSAKQLQP